MSAVLQSPSEGRWPQNVGILAIEMYFPSYCVNQNELEVFDGVSQGKYTIGLGQKNMGFCSDMEDIHSLCLTVVQALMERNGVRYEDVGWMEVGTETILDKSKSVKSVLMQLFEESGNTNVEGIDTTNACYGGTQALFNALSWVESSAWDGRFALVVAGDIAVYASGNARPTGGAGAVAMLVGPNAPLVLERGLRAVHMRHAYDFYKPDLSSEYPVVDGQLSILCYLEALDKCYQRFADKASQLGGKPFTIDDASFFIFHCPFAKLVAKSLARLKVIDFTRNPEGEKFAGMESLGGRTLEDTMGDKSVEKIAVKCSAQEFKDKTDTSLLLGREVGNMYTASLYGGLVSILAKKSIEELAGKRVVMFSYGSGLASAMYSIRISADSAPTSDLSVFLKGVSGVCAQLASRKVIPPAEFEKIMVLREKANHTVPYTPVGEVKDLFPGTCYLTSVDEKHRRAYSRVPPTNITPIRSLRRPVQKEPLANGSL